MLPDTLANIERAFTYHRPTGTQTERYRSIRLTAKEFALDIMRCRPDSRERSLALTNLQQCVMGAIASMAINENQI